MEVFARRIKELRIKHGMWQQEMADSLGTTKATISRWEAGKHTPDLETLAKIAEHFNIKAGYLIGTEN